MLFLHLLRTPGAFVVVVYAHSDTPIVRVNYRPGQTGFTLLRFRVFFEKRFLVIYAIRYLH